MKNFLLSIVLMFVISLHHSMAQESGKVITFEIGDVLVSVLSEGLGDGNSGMLMGVSPEVLQKYLPNGTFPLETNAFLIRTTDNKNILIDTGAGKHLLDNLSSLGISPEQINTILLTHMHGDHIGGLLHEGEKMFPNSDLYISQAEYDYWRSKEVKPAHNVIDIYKEKLHLFVPDDLETDLQELLPGIKPISAYGHTPGHTAFMIESNQSRLLIWGDLIHVGAIQIPHPEVALKYDADTKKAILVRQNILDYVTKNKIPVGGMHIVFPAIGDIKVKNQEEKYEFLPFCTCLGL